MSLSLLSYMFENEFLGYIELSQQNQHILSLLPNCLKQSIFIWFNLYPTSICYIKIYSTTPEWKNNGLQYYLSYHLVTLYTQKGSTWSPHQREHSNSDPFINKVYRAEGLRNIVDECHQIFNYQTMIRTPRILIRRDHYSKDLEFFGYKILHSLFPHSNEVAAHFQNTLNTTF